VYNFITLIICIHTYVRTYIHKYISALWSYVVIRNAMANHYMRLGTIVTSLLNVITKINFLYVTEAAVNKSDL